MGDVNRYLFTWSTNFFFFFLSDMPMFVFYFFNVFTQMTTNKAELQKDSKKSTKRHGEAKTERSLCKKRVFKTKNVIKYHSTVIDNIINRRLYGTIYVVSISSSRHQNTHLFTKILATFLDKNQQIMI